MLTDTFQMTEEGDQLDLGDFIENSERVLRQNELPITVIVGNPPYSSGQKNADDDNENESYPTLDGRIEQTYVRGTDSSNKRQMYDSYIRSFRWASDRIGEQGVVCFVSNAGWLRASMASGLRKCFAEEFDDIYVFDLRGNQRTQGEESRREGGKVFGSGSRTPVAITLLVKRAGEEHAGRIHYHDIGDYLSRDEKLDIVSNAAASGDVVWQDIEPDKYGDWFDQRDDSFYEFAPIGIEKYKEPSGIFETYSLGIATGRDAWVWNYSAASVQTNMRNMSDFYNSELERYNASEKLSDPKEAVTYNPQKISWNRNLFDNIRRGIRASYIDDAVVVGMYRPFCKQHVYYVKQMIAMTYQQPRLFPLTFGERGRGRTSSPSSFIDNAGKGGSMTYQQVSSRCLPNRCISLVFGPREFSCLMTDVIPDIQLSFNGQCFPLYWYEEAEIGSADGVGDGSTGTDSDGGSQGSLFDVAADSKTATGSTNVYKDGYVRHDAITDETLAVFRAAYPQVFQGRSQKDGGSELTKEDIFYYVYGILHSPEYRQRFAANLAKELPRIPLARDFAAFSHAGRKLADLHLGYETIEPWAEITEDGNSANPGRTEKIRFGKCKKTEENPKGVDRTVLHVAQRLTLKNIPEAAYSYVVNGRSAIEWLIDRYQVRTDKASGIVNDPNDYSDDPRYIVDLVKRVVTVSIKTMETVANLPALNERPQPENWPDAWKIPTTS